MNQHAQFRELFQNRIKENEDKCEENKRIGKTETARLYNFACAELLSLKIEFNKLPDVAAELEETIEFALKEKPFTARGEGFRSGILHIQNILKRINKLKELSK